MWGGQLLAMRLTVSIVAFAVASCGPAPPVPDSFERVSTNTVQHGERLSRVMGCVGCHGDDLTGKDWSDEFGTLWTANLTRSAAQHDDDALAAMIATGRQAGDNGRSLLGMPSFLFTRLKPDEMAAVLAFIRSRPAKGTAHPPPTQGPQLRALIASGEILTSVQEVAKIGAQPAPVAGPGHARARHIVRATCVECHGIDLAGGKGLPGEPPRPDIRAIAAAYSDADFERLLTTGVAAGGRRLDLMREVALGRYANLTPAERRAIHSYLRELAARAAR